MSSDWKEVERRIASVTKSGRRPVTVTFLDGEPADIKKFEDSEPSSCSFWRLAANGRTFLHAAGKPLQLRRGRLHAQYPIVGRQGKGNRTNAEEDFRTGLCEARGGATDTAPREGA